MHYVIYVPGLGDHNSSGQERLFSLWRLWDVKPVMVHMLWADKKPFAPKLERLLAKIDDLATGGNTVSLVGASAGASATLAAFAARKDTIHKVALLCGEVKVGVRIKQSYQDENPAFVESMDMLGASLGQLSEYERKRIRSYHPIFDETVPVGDTKITGTPSKLFPIIGHPLGIGYGLTAGSFGITRWLKR